VEVIIGAKTRDLVIMEEEMKQVADQVYVCTDDGSYGFKGLVTAKLKELMDAGDNDKAEQGLIELEETALELWVFIEKFSCQPLIYTGQGSTDEIIRRLEWALTFVEEFDPAAFKKRPSNRKQRMR